MAIQVIKSIRVLFIVRKFLKVNAFANALQTLGTLKQWSAGPPDGAPFLGAREGNYPHPPGPIADTAKFTEKHSLAFP